LPQVLFFLFPLYSVLASVQRSWTCDDAFISFRYALNLSRGYGLVFNRGEYVEGMTNFLWTVLLAPFLYAELDAEKTASVLGIIFHAALFPVVVFFGRKLFGDLLPSSESEGRFRMFLSGVPWLTFSSLAFHLHMQLYATSGLETSLFIFLSTTGFLFTAVFLQKISKLIRSAAAEEKILPGFSHQQVRFGAGGLFFLSLASLVRPDGLLFYGTASVFIFYFQIKLAQQRAESGWLSASKQILLNRKRAFSLVMESLRLHFGFVLIFIPVWLFRYLYYGSFLPNTFYAKSAYDPYFSQGLSYLLLYFKSYYGFSVLSVVLCILFLMRFIKRSNSYRSFFDSIFFFFLSVIAVWFLYVLQVGGDFMFARFILPVTPLMFLFLERSFLKLKLQKVHYYMLAALSVLMIYFRFDVFSGLPYPLIGAVTEESRVYTPERRKTYREFSLYFKDSLRGLDPVVAFKGGNAAMIYYLDLSTAIEATTGLTDSYIASQKLKQRGRIGHEKNAPLDYLIRRKVSFILGTMPPERNYGYNTLRIKGYPGDIEILTWQPGIMESLKRSPEFSFADFPSYLDSLDLQKGISKEDLARYKKYYFNYTEDTMRLKKLEKSLR